MPSAAMWSAMCRVTSGSTPLNTLAAVLHELHVAPVFHLALAGAAQEAVVVADVVGEPGRAAGGADEPEAGPRAVLLPLDQHGGGDIAED